MLYLKKLFTLPSAERLGLRGTLEDNAGLAIGTTNGTPPSHGDLTSARGLMPQEIADAKLCVMYTGRARKDRRLVRNHSDFGFR